MSLIIQPSDADRGKTFYATKVLPYLKFNGPVRQHIDADLIGVFCMQTAIQKGCEDIVVCPEGHLPVRFTIRRLWEMLLKNPTRYRGWYQAPPQSVHERIRQRIISKHVMPSTE